VLSGCAFALALTRVDAGEQTRLCSPAARHLRKAPRQLRAGCSWCSRGLVRNGYHEPHEVLTNAGAVEVTVSRVNDKRVGP
jgi:hypothetical protein